MRLPFLFLLCAYLGAADFSWQDRILESAALAALYADWSQSRDIARHPGLRETNPILGDHPSAASINRYFVAATAIQLTGVFVLTGRARKAWIIGWVGVESFYIRHNASLGLAIHF